MTARVHAHSPGSLDAARRPPPAGQARLPWWALALPALAFAVLLALLVGGGPAQAAGPPPVQQTLGQVLERVEQTLLG